MRKILFFLTMFILSIGSTTAQLDFSGTKKFTHADSLRGGLNQFRSCYDVVKYDLNVSVDPETKTIKGFNRIKFKVVSACSRIQLDLFSNMELGKVSTEGKTLSTTRDGNAFFIDFPSGLDKGSIHEILVEYSGKPQIAVNPPWDGGFSWEKDKNKNHWIGVSCQGTGASLWWPCKDHQSDEPDTMWIRVNVPTGYTDVSNGRLIRKREEKNNTTTFDWLVSSPINNYDVTVNIAKYAHFSDFYKDPNYADTLSLDYYVLPENLSAAKKQFQQVKPMMECYYHLFGEYPFVKDGYKLVETSYLGMEHQSAVAYGNHFKNGYLGVDLSGSDAEFDYIIIHESAHEWWGNSITTNDIADMWVHEGFGTYAEALYMECTAGKKAYDAYINGLTHNIRNDVPIIGPYGVNEEGSGDMYPKGALLLHTLRSVIDNDPLFFQIIKGLQTEYKWKVINSSDVERYFTRVSGLNLQPIFDQYLRTTFVPTLEIEMRQKGANTELHFRWLPDKDLVPTFDLPIKIALGPDQEQLLFPQSDWQTLVYKNQQVNTIRLNEKNYYIKINKTISQ